MKKQSLTLCILLALCLHSESSSACSIHVNINDDLCVEMESMDQDERLVVNLILRGPQIKYEDLKGVGQMTDREFSLFVSDSLRRYLDSKKDAVNNILAEYDARVAEDSSKAASVDSLNSFSVTVLLSKKSVIKILENHDDLFNGAEKYVKPEKVNTLRATKPGSIQVKQSFHGQARHAGAWSLTGRSLGDTRSNAFKVASSIWFNGRTHLLSVTEK